MKKKTYCLMLAGMVSLLMFQFSCAGVQQDSEAAPAAQMSEKGAKELPADALLADKHEAAGNSCGDCHAEEPPAANVPTDTCLTCHEDYRELAASYLDPHNAHVAYSNCSDCHHVHRESEMICQGCHHTFNVRAP